MTVGDFGLAAQAIGGIALVLAGAAKLVRPFHFLATLHEYPLPPFLPLALLAWMVPSAEVATGVAIIIGVRSAWLMLAAEGLLVCVSSLLLLRWFRGEREIVCGCFGGGDRPISIGLLLFRNVVLAAVLAWAWASGPTEGWPSADQVLTASVIAATGTLLFRLLESTVLAFLWLAELERAP